MWKKIRAHLKIILAIVLALTGLAFAGGFLYTVVFGYGTVKTGYVFAVLSAVSLGLALEVNERC